MKKEDKSMVERSKSFTKTVLAVVFFAIAVFIFFVPYLFKKKEDGSISSYSEISEICELATLRCYYHNAAETTVEPEGLFKYGLFKYGYKKFWIEYDGIIEFGIEAGKVDVHEPDSNGVVKIYVPQAQVLNVYSDPDTINVVIVDTGKFTNISVEDHALAHSYIQAEMKEKAEDDTSSLAEARENAKNLLKDMIINAGNKMGKAYKVVWIDDAPNEQQTKSSETSEGI